MYQELRFSGNNHFYCSITRDFPRWNWLSPSFWCLAVKNADHMHCWYHSFLCAGAPMLFPAVSSAPLSASVNTARKLATSFLHFCCCFSFFFFYYYYYCKSFDFADPLKGSWGLWGVCGPLRKSMQNTIMMCFRAFSFPYSLPLFSLSFVFCQFFSFELDMAKYFNSWLC